MNVQIRPLRPSDIECVEQIERQAFPTLWPPTPFKRELGNRIAKYLVAWEPSFGHGNQGESSSSPRPRGRSFLGRVLGALKGSGAEPMPGAEAGQRILGFVGLWFMADEAHITAIAVEEASRGKGIGELLLVGSIELAMDRQATEVTLEARVSNHIAQSLYNKYGFHDVGIRKGYYTDNREDAVIMTTNPINTPTYHSQFRGLREAYRQRHGDMKIVLA